MLVLEKKVWQKSVFFIQVWLLQCISTSSKIPIMSVVKFTFFNDWLTGIIGPQSSRRMKKTVLDFSNLISINVMFDRFLHIPHVVVWLKELSSTNHCFHECHVKMAKDVIVTKWRTHKIEQFEFYMFYIIIFAILLKVSLYMVIILVIVSKTMYKKQKDRTAFQNNNFNKF